MAIPGSITLSTQEQGKLEELHAQFPLNILPNELKPYAELLRITKPIGIAMFYYPLLYSSFLLGTVNRGITLPEVIQANAKLLLLAIILRGHLCTWNDMIDQDLDREVTRTRIRPLPRGAVTMCNAAAFFVLQTGLLLGYFHTLLPGCCKYAIPTLALHIAYPLAKRITHHPQVMLGLAFSSEILISIPALGQDFVTYQKHDPSSACIIGVGLAITLRTLLFDTIYAGQDLEDDKRAGIGSTLVFWERQARNLIRVVAALTVAAFSIVCFSLAPISTQTCLVYTIITCGGSAAGLLWMVESVDLSNPVSCAWWFAVGNFRIGLLAACGIIFACLVAPA